MRLNTKCSVALHCLVFLSEYEDQTKITSELLAKSTGCNSSAIRSILNDLQKAGIVSVVRGIGGAHLNKAPADLTFWDVYHALEPGGLEHFIGFHPNPSDKCPVGRQITPLLEQFYQKIGGSVREAMEQLTLRQLLDAYHGQEAALKKYVRDYLPMFRDSDAQGLIGARAYLYYFQDMSTLHLHQMGKGNDTLPETYGAAWIYTKYKIKICRRADYTRPLHMETWIEKQDKLRIWQDLKISAGNETYALGRLESCVFHLNEQKIGLLSDIDMPEAMASDQKIPLGPFARLKRNLSEMEYVYTHTVRYSDLDKSHHMANHRYVTLMENVFSPDFFTRNELKELEIHYISQGFYGDEIRLYKKESETGYLITGARSDGTIVFTGCMIF